MRHLNGQQLGGSQLIVTPASTLRKLFIGNIERTVGAPRLHDAIASVCSVRGGLRGGGSGGA